jgi:hypothetical protein
MIQKLGVESKHHSRYTELIFNKKKIIGIAVQYNYSVQTNLDFGKVNDDDDGEHHEHNEHNTLPMETVVENNRENNNDFQNVYKETAQVEINNDECSNLLSANGIPTNNDNQETNNKLLLEPSQRSPCAPTQDNLPYCNIEEEIQRSIFRVGRSDNWGCKNCKQHGDKWYMRQHQCSGLAKKQAKTTTTVNKQCP